MDTNQSEEMKMTHKLPPSIALNMTIADLAKHFQWHISEVERLVLFVLWDEESSAIREKYGRGWRKDDIAKKEMRAWASKSSSKITLQDLISEHESYDPTRRKYWNQALTVRLKRIGLSRLDTWLLPRSTVTLEMLARLSREDLLKCDAFLLGTLSANRLHWIKKLRDSIPDEEWVMGRRPKLEVLTIGELLSVSRSSHGMTKTLLVLEKLGFTAEDGIFMSKEDDPRDEFARALIKDEGLPPKQAKRFAEIAAKRNWI